MSRAVAMLLAAGRGTRLRPLTDHTPKCLASIAGRPILDYWLDALAAAGVRDVRINTHAHADRVRGHIERINQRGGLRLSEAYEPRLLGSAGTLAANARFADDADQVIVVYADNFSDVDLAGMLAFHRAHEDPATMLLFHAPDPSACGIAELDDAGRVIRFEEKPERPAGDLANAGVYVFDAACYREIAAMEAFDIGFDVLPRLVGRMRGWITEGYHRDIGSMRDYEAVRGEAHAVLRRRGMDREGRRPAVFFDRDGTVIEQVAYLGDPSKVRLSPYAAGAIRRLRGAGFACVVVSNQSAIGRGMIGEADWRRVNERMCELFAGEGAVFDAIEYCPLVPGTSDRTVVEHPDRKPGGGMLVRAAEELGLNLKRSWMIGDMVSDVLAGQNAGCRGSILVETGFGVTPAEREAAGPFESAADLSEAADLILRNHRSP